MGQIINRNLNVIHKSTEGHDRLCPTLRNRNRVPFETAVDLWICMPCLREGRRTIFLQPNAIGLVNAPRNRMQQAAFRELRCYDCQRRDNLRLPIAQQPPTCVPEAMCHDVDACLFCSDHIMTVNSHRLVNGASVIDPSTVGGRLLTKEMAWRDKIIADEKSGWAAIEIDASVYNSDYRRRAQHVVGTRLQSRSDAANQIGEMHSALSRTVRGVERSEIAKYVHDAVVVVSEILQRSEIAARDITAPLELQRQLREVDSVGWRGTFRRFRVAYYHPRAGPKARSWFPSIDRARWAWSVADI